MSKPNAPSTDARTINEPTEPASEHPGILSRAWEWYYVSFLTHFLIYFPLPLVLILLGILLLNGVGDSYGVDKLVWHDNPVKQFFVGVSMTLVLAFVFFVGYLLWLRDRREGYLRTNVPAVGYGWYSWFMLFCFLITGAVIVGAGYAVAFISPTDTPTSDIVPSHLESSMPMPYDVPFLFLTGALASGFGFWFLLHRGAENAWYSPSRLVQLFRTPTKESSNRGVQLFVLVLILAGCLGVCYWFQERLFASSSTQTKPPGYWWLPLGGFAGGVVLWLMKLLSNALGAREGLGVTGFQKTRDWLKKLLWGEEEPWESRRESWASRPFWVSALILLGMWGFVFYMTLPQGNLPFKMWLGSVVVLVLGLWFGVPWRQWYDQVSSPKFWGAVVGSLVVLAGAFYFLFPASELPLNTFGILLVLIGLVLTLCPIRWPRESTFALCLIANMMVAIALLTLVPSHFPVTWRLLLLYSLAPLAVGLVCVLLICYAPKAAAAFFGRVGEKKKQSPEWGSPEELFRRRAYIALLLGWLFFVGLSAFDGQGGQFIPDWVSPVAMVCALLFVSVAIYGFLAYVGRGLSALLVVALVLLAVLSGVNRYKYRFAGSLDRYDSMHPSIAEDCRPLGLDGLLAEDLENIGEAEIEFDKLAQSNMHYERLVAERNSLRAFLWDQADVPEVSEQFEAFEDGLRAQEEEIEKAEQGLLEQCREVRTVIQSLRKETRIVGSFSRSDVDRILASHLDEPEEDSDRFLVNRDLEKWGARSELPSSAIEIVENREGKATATSKKPLILIAVSGGGLRAAYWTLHVLRQLELRFAAEGRDFPSHVRLITGASGGMLGAAYYVAKLDAPDRQGRALEPNRKTLGKQRADMLQGQLDSLGKDFITPLMKQMVFGDVPNAFSPWPARFDRGKALENAWDVHLGGDLDISFGELRDKEKAGWCPSLVFAPMMIEDGRRLIISNFSMYFPIHNDGMILDLDENQLKTDLKARGVSSKEAERIVCSLETNWRQIALQIRAYDEAKRVTGAETPPYDLATAIRENYDLPDPVRERGLNGTYSIEAFELFRLFPKAKDDFKLKTAVRMSASFPFFSPAVSLPTWPRRRVVDAGYFDNYGVSLTASWLFSGSNSQWIEENVSKVCIIQIRDGVSDDYRRLLSVQKDLSSKFSRALEELVSPVQGLDSARVSSASFRNDGQLELLSQRMRENEIPFTVVNFEYSGSAALNWVLSKNEAKQIDELAEDVHVRNRIRSLLDFLFSPEPPSDENFGAEDN